MHKKILLTYITLILIAVLITGALSLSLLQVNYIDLIEDKLITNSTLIRQFLNNQSSIDDFNNLSKIYSNKIDTRVTFINKEGWVIGDSEADINKLQNHKDRPEIKQAFKGEIGVNRRYSSSLKKDMFYVAIPFENEKSKLAVIRLSVPLSDITYWNKMLFKYIIISIVTGLFVAIILGFRLVKSFTQPIKDLTDATKKISSGNYGEKVYVKTGDEIGILADNFNTMSEKLDNTISEIEDRNSKTKAILTSMINGIIALDNNKRIVFVNPAIEDMFGFNENEIKGKHILELVKSNILDYEIEELINSSIAKKIEIEIHEPRYRILNVYSNAIRLNKDIKRKIGVVLIFQDVTEIRKLESMRKDFVANVSHELKTPLTSIRGFIETLKNGAIEEENLRNKFIDIIDIEAERLFMLIQDILILSEIENKNSNSSNKELIDINKSLNIVMEMMYEIAKKKNIELIKQSNNKNMIINGNKSWFKQMLINVIDNAIKYTPDGGKVLVEIYDKERSVIIKVKDTGIGIDKEHINRLFERFYRVEKARSRQIEGTGLGLAIVKHIVLSFNGEIKLKSKVNRGSEFTIIIPI